MTSDEKRSFFFSSRRRHTRSLRDWSSDVCSSDLPNATGQCAPPHEKYAFLGSRGPVIDRAPPSALIEIGRASCRERVEMLVVAVLLKIKHDQLDFSDTQDVRSIVTGQSNCLRCWW